MDDQARAELAERAAAAGATVARDAFRTAVEVETKADAEPVTQIDRDAQRRVAEVIGEERPGETVVGEEGETPKSIPEGEPAWVVDPIDGTKNFVRGARTWGTSVAAVTADGVAGAANVFPALEDAYVAGGNDPIAGSAGATRNGEPISVSDVSTPERALVGPLMLWTRDRRDEFATALGEVARRFDDVRRVGSAQAMLSRIAAGEIDGTFTNLSPPPWDTVAGVALIRAAGGRVTDLDGDRWSPGDRGLVASNGDLHDALLDAAQQLPRGVDQG
ncbi:inositol monophosphatase [Halostella sp. JP-L12]|uniref:inositol monophosphatase family protein n=1 Tax=Halostella TaxID=1843185 RepID=UPI000EF79F55|nr:MULTISPECIES: inositol monophosphatase [Halostella]NHN48455.1 inositol monophosphatase [Halostella sp. JP-L12]